MTEPVYDAIPSVPLRSIVTQYGVPISATEAIRGLKVGTSLVVDNDAGRRCLVSTAYRLGITIKTAKEDNGRYRICLK
jgi:hypothetical protein